jgi:hypothetical protein
MKIKDLNLVGIGLRKLGDIPMSGPMKFKIARNIKIVEDILQDAMSSSEDIDNDDALLDMDVKVDLIDFTEDELEPLELDSKTIFMLLPLIEIGGEDDE